MHIADLSRGNLGANGVVGGGHAIAVGAALSTQMQEIDRIVVCFFGDGASNEGSFHESLNLASVWKLPVLFVCENNLYGMSTPIRHHMNITDISKRAAAYGIPGKSIDGNDAVLIYQEACKAKEYVKKNGPMLLVLNTYRYMGHSKSDANVYRTKEEINEWKQKDPIKRMKEYLLANKVFDETELDKMEADAARQIEDALKFAESSPLPSLDTVLDDVYA
jgi:pyruvate dehydrogenase E1 component alpha subunit